MSRSKWVQPALAECILAGLTRENAEALRLSYDYGVRIGDVLQMRRESAECGRWRFREQKTGKYRDIKLSAYHRDECLAIAGRIFVFEGRLDYRKPRTRQAVFKDLQRVADALRLKHLSPHSFRKCFAVNKYRQTCDLRAVQRALGHSDEAVTAIYAFAQETARRRESKPRAPKRTPHGD